jgi:succinyl-diaminopimelate desuccinylase
VGLIVVADEETGSRYGLGYLLKHHGHIFSPEDLIIVPDAGNEDGTMIEIAEKSMLWLKFTVNGPTMPCQHPAQREKLSGGRGQADPGVGGTEGKFASSNPLFSPPVSTFEPTKFLANVSNVNTIPGKEVFYMDCRILPEHNVDDVIETARKIASKVAGETELDIKMESEHRHDAPMPTPAGAPVVAALQKAVKRSRDVRRNPWASAAERWRPFFGKPVFLRRYGPPVRIRHTNPMSSA